MIESERGKLLMALGKAIDETPYAAVYGDRIWTHVELLRRFKNDLIEALGEAIDELFGPCVEAVAPTAPELEAPPMGPELEPVSK